MAVYNTAFSDNELAAYSVNSSLLQLEGCTFSNNDYDFFTTGGSNADGGTIYTDADYYDVGYNEDYLSGTVYSSLSSSDSFLQPDDPRFATLRQVGTHSFICAAFLTASALDCMQHKVAKLRCRTSHSCHSFVSIKTLVFKLHTNEMRKSVWTE